MCAAVVARKLSRRRRAPVATVRGRESRPRLHRHALPRHPPACYPLAPPCPTPTRSSPPPSRRPPSPKPPPCLPPAPPQDLPPRPPPRRAGPRSGTSPLRAGSGAGCLSAIREWCWVRARRSSLSLAREKGAGRRRSGRERWRCALWQRQAGERVAAGDVVVGAVLRIEVEAKSAGAGGAEGNKVVEVGPSRRCRRGRPVPPPACPLDRPLRRTLAPKRRTGLARSGCRPRTPRRNLRSRSCSGRTRLRRRRRLNPTRASKRRLRSRPSRRLDLPLRRTLRGRDKVPAVRRPRPTSSRPLSPATRPPRGTTLIHR